MKASPAPPARRAPSAEELDETGRPPPRQKRLARGGGERRAANPRENGGEGAGRGGQARFGRQQEVGSSTGSSSSSNRKATRAVGGVSDETVWLLPRVGSAHVPSSQQAIGCAPTSLSEALSLGCRRRALRKIIDEQLADLGRRLVASYVLLHRLERCCRSSRARLLRLRGGILLGPGTLSSRVSGEKTSATGPPSPSRAFEFRGGCLAGSSRREGTWQSGTRSSGKRLSPSTRRRACAAAVRIAPAGRHGPSTRCSRS